MFRRFVLPLLLFSLLCQSALAAKPDRVEKVYVSSGVWSYFIEIDLVTLERRSIQLDDYPRIIKASHMAIEPGGTVLIETIDAAQRAGMYRVDPATGAKSPVAGFVDGFSEDPIGNGPPFSPYPNTLIMGNRNELFALLSFTGPMRVELSSGDRKRISQSVAPVVGTGFPILNPVDMLLLDSSTLLVSESFQGLVLIDSSTGARELGWAGDSFPLPPRRIDLLNDGRIVYSANEPEIGALFALDRTTSESTILSGSFGGISVGKGEAIGSAGDLAVGFDGIVFLYDNAGPAVFRIEPESGARTLIAGPDTGTGEPLIPVTQHPSLAVQRRLPHRPLSLWALH